MSERDELHALIVQQLRAVVAALDGLDEVDLNAMPPVEGMNSPYVLAAHTLGNARAWALGIACQQRMRRDRSAEFASAAPTAAALRADFAALEAAMAEALPQLTDLDREVMPAQELWGVGQPHAVTVRGALLRVVRHASLHLGHLEITRDLLLGGK